jgi:HlyD family secretion protein
MGAVAAWLVDRYVISKTVIAFKVENRPLEWTLRGPGLVDATNKVSLTAKVQARLATVNVERNQRVKEGEVIATFEADDLTNQLGAIKAEADAAGSAIGVARSSESRARTALEKLRSDLARREKLAASGVVSRVEIDTLQSQVRQAEAELLGATTSIQRAEAQKRSADANVKSMLARLEEATIRSPLTGVIVSRERNVGDVVLPGALIAQAVDPASIIVSARFDESNMSSLTPGQPAKVAFLSAPRIEYPGKILRIGRQVDVETREFTADIVLERLPDNWALGQRATVLVATKAVSEVPLVPQRFIHRSGGKAGVWQLQGGRASWRSISLGHATGPYIEVTGGVKAGDTLLDPFDRYSWEPVMANVSWQ